MHKKVKRQMYEEARHQAIAPDLKIIDPSEKSTKLAHSFLNRLEKLQIVIPEMPINQEDPINDTSDLSPVILSSTNRLVFEIAIKLTASSVVTLYNRGNIAVHFEWILIDKPNPLNVKNH